jgi:hypothetical protein
MASVRKALGVAAWLVLGIQTKDTRVPKKPQLEKGIVRKAALKPRRFSNPLKRIVQPGQPKNREIKVQSEKVGDQIENAQVDVAEAITSGGEGAVGLKTDVEGVLQVGSIPQVVIPKPIPLEDVVKNEGLTSTPALSKAEEADLGPEPVVKKIEHLAEIPNKTGELKTETVPQADDADVEIKFEKPVFEKKPEKTEAEKAADIQASLSSLFTENLEEEVSTLDGLIASLPNVTIDEILTEIQDVESILGEYVEAK